MFGLLFLLVFVLTDFTRAVRKGIPNLCFQRLVNSSFIIQKPWLQFSPAGDNSCHVCLPVGEFSRNQTHLDFLKVFSDLDGHSRHPILSQKCVAYLFFPQYFEVKTEQWYLHTSNSRTWESEARRWGGSSGQKMGCINRCVHRPQRSLSTARDPEDQSKEFIQG